MKLRPKSVLRTSLLLLAAAVFVCGAADYLSKNGSRLLSMSLGAEQNAPPDFLSTPPPSAVPAPEQDSQDSVETALEWDRAPVDFLEEILPEVTPDPSRASAPVEELECGGGTQVDNFFVSDTSESGLNLLEELQKPLPFDTSSIQSPTVLIYHTHTCESYMTGFSGYYYMDTTFRSTSADRNVIAVGERMKQALEAKGIGVIHDTTVHDSPSFNGAYQRSMETVQKNLAENPSIKVTIDLHRDAMVKDTGLSYKPTATIDGRKAAQVMIIAGSDPTGELEFVNWRDNLIFALKIQKKAADLYSGLMRPVMYCQRKYNMDATNASLIFEVGTGVNTFSEANYSGELMGNLVAEVLLEANGGNLT